MASTSIQRSRTAGTTKTKFTISMWVKRADNAAKYLLVNYTDDANRALFQFGGSDELLFQQRVSNSLQVSLQTNRKFRDPNGWYAITLTGDSTLAASADRLKLFVNGVRETSFATDTQLSQDSNYYINEATTNGFRIGEKGDGSDYFNGLMSHVHFCDGYAYEASAFGSTDSVTGEWQINTSPSVSYGTNGFFLKMEDSSNMDLDSSSNALTFTTNGTLTKSECCPSNVFATWNPLLAMNSSMSLANGNTKATTGNGYDAGRSNSYFSTLGMTKGKYYAEFKVVTAPSAACLIGVGYDLSSAQQGTTTNQYNLSFTNLGFSYNSVGSIGNDGDGWTSTGYDTYTADDYIGIAIDCDNWKLYVSKNGTWQNSGTGFSITADKEYFFAVSDNNGAQVYVYEANFGNGCFGSTQLTGTTYNGADGNGIFKYDPNNITLDSTTKSFKSLSTKGLNS